MRRARLFGNAVVLLLSSTLFLPTGAQSQESPLFRAAREGRAERIHELIGMGAAVDTLNEEGITPLILAAAVGQTEAVEALLSLGADPDLGAGSASGWEGASPLLFASEMGHLAVIGSLLDADAEINARSLDGETALMVAARAGRTEAVRLLLERGAFVDVRDGMGVSALMFAAANGHPDIVELLLDKSAAVNGRGSAGSALHFAAEVGSVEVTRVLLEHGATAGSPNDFGQTPLMLAAGSGHAPVVRLLLDAGADMNAVDADGDCALGFYAAANGHRAVVEVLIEAGASVNLSNHLGITPLDYAISNGHTAVETLLSEAGAQGGDAIERPSLAGMHLTLGDLPPGVVIIQDEGNTEEHTRTFASSGDGFPVGSSTVTTLTTSLTDMGVPGTPVIQMLRGLDEASLLELLLFAEAPAGGLTRDSAWVLEERTPGVGETAAGWKVRAATPLGDIDLVAILFSRGKIGASLTAVGARDAVSFQDIEGLAAAFDARIEAGADAVEEQPPRENPEAIALLDQGTEWVREGRVEEALGAFRAAEELDPEFTIPASYSNELCWYGSLWGFAEAVMDECERAVALASPGSVPAYRDSRGLARALTGDFQGAIEDFRIFVRSVVSDEDRATRVRWMDILSKGEDPFTEAELKKLLEPVLEAREARTRLEKAGFDFSEALPAAEDLGLSGVLVNDAWEPVEGKTGRFTRSFATSEGMVFSFMNSRLLELSMEATLYPDSLKALAELAAYRSSDPAELTQELLGLNEVEGVEIEVDAQPVPSLATNSFLIGGTIRIGLVEIEVQTVIFSVGPTLCRVVLAGRAGGGSSPADAQTLAEMVAKRLEAGAG